MGYLGPGLTPNWVRALLCGLVLLLVGVIAAVWSLESQALPLIGIAVVLVVPGGLLTVYGARLRVKARART